MHYVCWDVKIKFSVKAVATYFVLKSLALFSWIQVIDKYQSLEIRVWKWPRRLSVFCSWQTRKSHSHARKIWSTAYLYVIVLMSLKNHIWKKINICCNEGINESSKKCFSGEVKVEDLFCINQTTYPDNWGLDNYVNHLYLTCVTMANLKPFPRNCQSFFNTGSLTDMSISQNWYKHTTELNSDGMQDHSTSTPQLNLEVSLVFSLLI